MSEEEPSKLPDRSPPGKATDTPEKPRPWTADETVNAMKAAEPLIDKIADKWVKPILDYMKQKEKTTQKVNELSSKHDQKIVRNSLIFLSIITGAITFLAYLRVVSSDAVLYAFGALTGSILTLMVKFRFWVYTPEEEEAE